MNRKTIILFFIYCLFSFFAKAQDSKIHALKIGDHIPDFEFQNLSNSVVSSQKGSDLYKDGLLILNFWDTWCVPCVREMPYLDSIQAANGKQIHIVSVTTQSKSEIDKFLLGHPDFTHLLYSSADTKLFKYFPHSGVPHNVWIDKNGIVRAFTADDEINPNAIRKFLAGSYKLYMKVDTSFDFEKPLKVADTEFNYRSVFTGVKDEIGTGGIWLPNATQPKTRFIGWNIPKICFIWTAYMRSGFSMKFYTLTELHGKDTSSYYTLKHYNNHKDWLDSNKMKEYYDFRKNNFFCYEMSFDHQVNLDDFYSIMKQEVNLFFNVTAKVENRKTTCWVITRINQDKSLERSVSSSPEELEFHAATLVAKKETLKELAVSLGDMFENEPPFVDQTGIDYPVDISNNFGDISEGFTIEMLKKYLNSVGLDIKKKIVEYPHLIIYDRN